MAQTLAIVMGGGGARGAYQAGVLQGLAEIAPDLHVDIFTGASAGAINAAYLASHCHTFGDRAENLCNLWSQLSLQQVFHADFFHLAANVTRWALRLVSGGTHLIPATRGLVDTGPLEQLLRYALGAPAGMTLPGIAQNIEAGRLNAVAIATTCYTTGQTITWVQGRQVVPWKRPERKGVSAEISLQHVMASAALPLFFPAVRLDGRWYGDGDLRLTTPFSPAIRLGAEKVLGISTRYKRSRSEAEMAINLGYPPPAQIMGVLLNAIFLDFFDQDALRLQRINGLTQQLSPEDRLGLRPIKLMNLRPSVDLGRLANRYEHQLPWAFRFLTRGLGTREVRANDALSLVMFHQEYLNRLVEIGRTDALQQREVIQAFLESE